MIAIDLHDPGYSRTLHFDTVITNIGNCYNRYSSVFTAPASGVYFFSWTYTVLSSSEIITEIVKNADIIGTLIAGDWTHANKYSTSTKNVIVNINQGDTMFVRASSGYGTVYGSVISNKAMQASFSGFLLN